jgi:hypothetical protein
VNYETCLKAFGDLELCKFGVAAARLAEALKLDECLGRSEPQRCLDECLKSCREEDCADLCLDALDVAAAKSIAKRLAQEAVATAPKAGLEAYEAAALGLYMMTKEPGEDCLSRVVSTRVLGLAAIELRSLLKRQDVLLTPASIIASAYECIESGAFDILDALKPAVGQEMAERIADALEKGVVKIRRIELKFPPAKPFARQP